VARVAGAALAFPDGGVGVPLREARLRVGMAAEAEAVLRPLDHRGQRGTVSVVAGGAQPRGNRRIAALAALRVRMTGAAESRDRGREQLPFGRVVGRVAGEATLLHRRMGNRPFSDHRAVASEAKRVAPRLEQHRGLRWMRNMTRQALRARHGLVPYGSAPVESRDVVAFETELSRRGPDLLDVDLRPGR